MNNIHFCSLDSGSDNTCETSSDLIPPRGKKPVVINHTVNMSIIRRIHDSSSFLLIVLYFPNKLNLPMVNHITTYVNQNRYYKYKNIFYPIFLFSRRCSKTKCNVDRCDPRVLVGFNCNLHCQHHCLQTVRIVNTIVKLSC